MQKMSKKVKKIKLSNFKFVIVKLQKNNLKRPKKCQKKRFHHWNRIKCRKKSKKSCRWLTDSLTDVFPAPEWRFPHLMSKNVNKIEYYHDKKYFKLLIWLSYIRMSKNVLFFKSIRILSQIDYFHNLLLSSTFCFFVNKSKNSNQQK